MIGFMVQGIVRVKSRIRVGLRLTLAFIIGAVVARANVVHSHIRVDKHEILII